MKQGGPGLVLMLFSIIAITPGSFGLTFSYVAAGTDSSDRMETAVGLLGNLLGLAIAIVSGQFIANALLPPIRSL